MKKDIIMILIGVSVGWIWTTWTNQPGKYQVVDVIHPKHQIHQTYLLNTRTGAIQQLVYGATENLYWAPEEALNEKEYDKRYAK